MNGFKDEQPKIGTGEGESPLAPPPQPKVDVRTMESDLKSLQETGGQAARPYAPPPAGGQPQEPVFQPPQVETPPPPPTVPSRPADISAITPSPEKKKGKKSVIVLIVILVIIGAVAAGYFFVYPALFPSAPEEVTQPPPAEEPPVTEEPPAQEPEGPSAANLPTVSTYSSYFKTQADASQDITLITALLDSFRELIPYAASTETSFKEIVVKNQNGQVIAFSGLMPLIAPNFFDSTTLNYFEDNYNVFVYTNEDGTWLGFIAKLKEGVDAGAIQSRMNALQNDSNDKNFFLVDVGEMGAWRDGTVKTKPTSLVDFTQTGATLSYAWFENFLLISTNLNGATEAATRLGF